MVADPTAGLSQNRSLIRLDTFSKLLALCEGNPLVTGGFPSQRPVTRNFGVFFDLCLSKQSRCWWFEMPSCTLWCHCNDHDKDTWRNLGPFRVCYQSAGNIDEDMEEKFGNGLILSKWSKLLEGPLCAHDWEVGSMIKLVPGLQGWKFLIEFEKYPTKILSMRVFAVVRVTHLTTRTSTCSKHLWLCSKKSTTFS